MQRIITVGKLNEILILDQINTNFFLKKNSPNNENKHTKNQQTFHGISINGKFEILTKGLFKLILHGIKHSQYICIVHKYRVSFIAQITIPIAKYPHPHIKRYFDPLEI